MTFKQDIDSTPMLKGLPNDQCHCPHWGYVLKGRVTFTVDGQDEVLEPGDAFYVSPGHLQRADAGTEYLQFSPAKEMAAVEQQINEEHAGDAGAEGLTSLTPSSAQVGFRQWRRDFRSCGDQKNLSTARRAPLELDRA